MSSLDLDLDAHMNNLEMEWRQAYESSVSVWTAPRRSKLGSCRR